MDEALALKIGLGCFSIPRNLFFKSYHSIITGMVFIETGDDRLRLLNVLWVQIKHCKGRKWILTKSVINDILELFECQF